MPQIGGQQVGPIGLGMIPLTRRDGAMPSARAFSVLRAAIETGCTCWNGSEFYGTPQHNSLTLLRDYFSAHPADAAKITLNVKGAFDVARMAPTGSPAAIRASVDSSLRCLDGVAKIDMFEMARRDVSVPLEESLGALGELVKEGKIGGVALTEVSAETIRRAAEIVDVVAVEVELSLWVREPLENGIVQTCGELGIPILAYCPLGHGMLTARMRSPDDAPEQLRKMFPRFAQENFDENLKLVDALAKFAGQKGCTPSQLALGWLLALAKKPGMPEIIPIPGTSSPEHVYENANPAVLTDQDMQDVERIVSQYEIFGTRYPETLAKLLDL